MILLLCYRNLFRLNNIHAIRIQSLPKPFRKCHCATNPPSFLSEYLQNSLGFSPERALTISQRLIHRSAKNPEAVLTFFKSQGLSETHIKSIINRVPFFLCYVSPASSLMPKTQFFRDKGISESGLVDLMVANPYLFTKGLERHIKPLLDVLCSILGTDELAVKLLIHSKLLFNLQMLSTNQSTLRNCGVQDHHVAKLLMKEPRALGTKTGDQFSKVVETVKGMGIKPQSSLFVDAVFRIVRLSCQTWDTKFKVYASLGWSAEETLSLFRKQPTCMSLSEEKIRRNFDYLTQELGWDPSYILIYPCLLVYSLEKRIIPRHRFLQLLASKGFIKEDKIFARSFMIGERQFLKNVVMRYESEVPDIMKIYTVLIGSKLINIKDGKDCNVH